VAAVTSRTETGVNYDVALLTFSQFRPGWIWGEAVWGESVWGVDTLIGSIGASFTSLTINRPCVVEQGLFVHAEAVTATLNTTDPAHLALKGQRLGIYYNGIELFYGTVISAKLVEAVEVAAPNKRGNTATRTHRVTLSLQQGTEYFATAPTPPRAFTNETLAVRLQSLVGTTTIGANVSSDIDVDSGVMENVGPWITDHQRVLVADDKGTLLDTIRDMLGRINKVLRPFFGDGRVEADSISRVATGSTIAGTLRFTDATVYETPSMSYSEREVDQDPAYFATGVAVTISGVRYGPYDAASQQRVAEVDLGVMDFAGADPQTARNFAATLPLRRKASPFTSRIAAPAQPELFTPVFPVPRLAILHRDGAEESIAIIGVTHNITPRGWLVEFDCAPPHLLTRWSDLDPSPAYNMTVSQPGGAGTAVQVQWKSPKNIPTDVPIYRTAYWQVFAAAGGEVSTNSGHNIIVHTLVNRVTEPAESTVTVSASGPTAPGPGLKFFYVQYTSDPSPASGVWTDVYRQGQACRVGYTVT
jgi:hypothetical protein